MFSPQNLLGILHHGTRYLLTSTPKSVDFILHALEQRQSISSAANGGSLLALKPGKKQLSSR
jgi:hypothetical protein